MKKSEKIKYLGVVGTLAIILTSYAIDANAYYKSFYLHKDVKSDFNDKKSMATKELDAKQVMDIEKSKLTMLKKESIKQEQNITKVDTKELNSSDCLLDGKKKRVVSPKYHKEDEKVVINQSKILRIFIKNGVIDDDSKKRIENFKKLISKSDRSSYVLVEGYSTSKSEADAQRLSNNYALMVSEVLENISIGKNIVIKGYGDKYPLVDDPNDYRNNRVEIVLKRR